jgi:hypothetical protein
LEEHLFLEARRMMRLSLRFLASVIAGLLVIGASGTRAVGQQWADWRQARPFVVRADFPLTGYEPLLEELQQLQQELVERLQVPPSNEPIEVYLFQTEAAYRAFVLSRYPQAPQRRALFIKSGGPGQVFAYRSPEFEVDLRHETTHALLHAALGGVPLWLDEGLAEYFEVASQDRLRNNPHLRVLKWNLWVGLAPRLSGLEEKRDLAEMGKREYLFAWAWVHYMLHGPLEARQALIAYLRDAQAGVPAESLSQRLERRLPNLEKRLAQHFMSTPSNKHWSG